MFILINVVSGTLILKATREDDTFMSTILTSIELSSYLDCLKNTIKNLNYSAVYNIIFFNVESFYFYFNGMICSDEKEYTVEEILDIIEPYIPFALTENTIDFFLEATTSFTDEEIIEVEKKLNTKAKVDFINCLRNIKTEKEWLYVKSICESIRHYKENNVSFASYFL